MTTKHSFVFVLFLLSPSLLFHDQMPSKNSCGQIAELQVRTIK